MQLDRFYHIKCEIYTDYSEFSVDGVKYASCTLNPGDVPTEGFFCMGNFREKHCLFKDLKVKKLSLQ